MATPATEAKLKSKRSDQPFFMGIAAAIVAFVFVGFARTFYLHQLFGVPAPTTFMSFHGVLMSGWIVLMFCQATLVARRRVLWHRRLGIFGSCYAAVIVVVGCAATLIAAAREVRAHSVDVASQLNVLALELTQMLLFACLVGSAVSRPSRIGARLRAGIENLARAGRRRSPGSGARRLPGFPHGVERRGRRHPCRRPSTSGVREASLELKRSASSPVPE